MRKGERREDWEGEGRRGGEGLGWQKEGAGGEWRREKEEVEELEERSKEGARGEVQEREAWGFREVYEKSGRLEKRRNIDIEEKGVCLCVCACGGGGGGGEK